MSDSIDLHAGHSSVGNPDVPMRARSRHTDEQVLCIERIEGGWLGVAEATAQKIKASPQALRLSFWPDTELVALTPVDAATSDSLMRARIDGLVRAHARSTQSGNAALWRAGSGKIPPSGKVVGEDEAAALVSASLDLWLTAGRFAAGFERALAKRFGVDRALAVNSGSSANLIALTTLTSPQLGARALRPGDEVITAAAGFPTTVNPILQNGLVPVFVDSELLSANIDVERIEAAISPRTKAIMTAHTLGNPMPMKALTDLARRYGLWLIEDCCDALGSTFDGQLCGTFGDLATLSFYPAHHITMGEGGAVFGRDPLLMRVAESVRDWGRDCYCAPGADNTCGKRFCWKLGRLPEGYDHKYTYSHAGYNLKITDMQAAVGLAQLKKLDHFIARRRANHAQLDRSLRDFGVERHALLPGKHAGTDPSWFGYLIVLHEDAPCTRNELTQYLEERGVGTRLLFAGNLTKQPYFEHRHYRVAGDLKNADVLMERAFWVGVWPGLDERQLAYVAQTIAAALGLNWGN